LNPVVCGYWTCHYQSSFFGADFFAKADLGAAFLRGVPSGLKPRRASSSIEAGLNLLII
jgi:hypothetical protein